MPDDFDPSFAREERRARARRAAAEASTARQEELRAKYAPPSPPPRAASSRPRARTGTGDAGAPIDVDAVAASARAALDDHPSTWTSYAELCAANGLDRRMAKVVARYLTPGPMAQHWFRIRDSDGMYIVPATATEREIQADADRALEATGVRVVARRADPERKLLWMHGEWCLAGR